MPGRFCLSRPANFRPNDTFCDTTGSSQPNGWDNLEPTLNPNEPPAALVAEGSVERRYGPAWICTAVPLYDTTLSAAVVLAMPAPWPELTHTMRKVRFVSIPGKFP
jgi:hypothetical protein